MAHAFPAILENSDVVTIQRAIDMDMRGPTAFLANQFILPAFSPRISVIESDKAIEMISSYDTGLNSILELLTYFEESVSQHGQRVRFVGDVLNNQQHINSELWDPKSIEGDLELYIKEINEKMKDTSNDKLVLENSIYLKYLTQILSSDSVTPFNCFSHPILRLIVVSGKESIDDVKELIAAVNINNSPKWIDLDSIKPTVLILVDDDDTKMLENSLNIQESLQIKSLIIPVVHHKEGYVKDITLRAPLFSNWSNCIQLSDTVFRSWNSQISEIVSKELLPYMNFKIRQWNDDIVTPKKSLTNRLFNTKKWGSSNKNSFFSFGKHQEDVEEVPNYNAKDGYYLAKSPEMIIKKLGDWYFMIGDYKNAYSTYDLVKKDMTNDKAYFHLAVLQESMTQSLLLGASKRLNIFTTSTDDKSTIQTITAKMITDVITPSIESTFYSYLSKYNLKSYCIRMSVLMAEHLFLLGQSMAYSNSQNPTSTLTSFYFSESLTLFKKLIDSKLLGDTVNSLLMQRVAYIYYSFDKPSIEPERFHQEMHYEEENPDKLQIPDMANIGRQRNRKSILWMLLAAKELDPESQPEQMKLIIEKIEMEMESNPGELEWLERDNSILNQLKSKCIL